MDVDVGHDLDADIYVYLCNDEHLDLHFFPTRGVDVDVDIDVDVGHDLDADIDVDVGQDADLHTAEHLYP